jgi:hypothetical protein
MSKTPLELLRHHVTGAIERGEKTAIVGVESKPIVERLPSPVHCGDWHDKPAKWQTRWGSKNQIFSTRKDAERYARVWRRVGYTNEIGAIHAFQDAV